MTGQPSFYERTLGLQHLRLPAWVRALLAEGSVVLGVLLSFADLASVWVVILLPIAVAAMVKFHDAVQGVLDTAQRPRA